MLGAGGEQAEERELGEEEAHGGMISPMGKAALHGITVLNACRQDPLLPVVCKRWSCPHGRGP